MKRQNFVKYLFTTANKLFIKNTDWLHNFVNCDSKYSNSNKIQACNNKESKAYKLNTRINFYKT